MNPLIKSAKAKKSWLLGTHRAILFGDIESAGPIHYAYILSVFNPANQPILHVTSEINQAIRPGGGSHFLGVFEGDKHLNMGSSNDWGDEAKFIEQALFIVQQRTGSVNTPPARPQPKKMSKKTKTWVWSIIVGLVVVIISAPYIIEYFAYRDAVTEKTRAATEKYISDYHADSNLNWKHFEEVFYYYLEATKSDSVPERTIFKARLFLWKFPTSPFAESVKQIKNDLIKTELEKLKAHFNQYPDGKVKAFYSKLLDHFISNDVFFANIHLKPVIHTKDLEDYPADVIDELALITEHPLKENMISLKSNFTESLLTQLDTKLKESVRESFSQVFPQKMFYTVLEAFDHHTINDPDYSDDILGMSFAYEFFDELAKLEAPSINIGYEIVNTKYVADGIEFPEIWTYTEDEVFRSYLLGISSDYTFRWSLPDSTSSIYFKDQSDPTGGDIRDISDVGQAYAIMVARTAIKFSENIKRNMSLDASDKLVVSHPK